MLWKLVLAQVREDAALAPQLFAIWCTFSPEVIWVVSKRGLRYR